MPIADCDGGTGSGQIFWNESQQLSLALGIAFGPSGQDPRGNYAVSAFTTNNPGDGKIEFQTAINIPLVISNRFITFRVDVSAVNCNQTHPSLQFSLLNDSGVAIPAGTQIDPCTSATSVNVPAIGVKGPAAIVVGTYTTNDPVLINGSSIGVRMVNNNGSGAGNDLAFDNIKILDVTPQLDKSFSSDEVGVGQTATLTLTVTNTNELAAKNGWSFTDNLPAGLTSLVCRHDDMPRRRRHGADRRIDHHCRRQPGRGHRLVHGDGAGHVEHDRLVHQRCIELRRRSSA